MATIDVITHNQTHHISHNPKRKEMAWADKIYVHYELEFIWVEN